MTGKKSKPKSIIFRSQLPLTLQQVYNVVSSEAYLCTDQEMESEGPSEISHSDYAVDEEGITHAVVHMRNQQEAAENVANPDVETGQAVAVQPIEDSSFAMHSLIALPGQIGNMRTILTFEAEQRGVEDHKNNGTTQVSAYVEVDIQVPKVGKELTKRLLRAAPDSVESGLSRIVRMAER